MTSRCTPAARAWPGRAQALGAVCGPHTSVPVLVRDGAQFRKGRRARRPDPAAAAEIEHLTGLLQRFQAEGMLRENAGIDLPAFARSVWMVSRFWIDHLVQDEARVEVKREDQERGMRHHFAVRMPILTDDARREVESALSRLADRTATRAA